MVWNKRLLWRPFVAVLLWSEQRSAGCRWAVLQSPVCVTSTEQLKLSFRRLGSESGSRSWDCTEVSSKTQWDFGWREPWEWRDTQQSFSGAVFHSFSRWEHPLLFLETKRLRWFFSTWPHHPSFCPWFCTIFILGDLCQFMVILKSIFRIVKVDFTHGLSLQT